MLTADFDFALPRRLIAQAPVEPRDSARLLVLDRVLGSCAQHVFAELPTLLRPGDVLVANTSRVLPARIVGHLNGGGRGELLLLRRLAPGRWEVLARPGRRLRVGAVLRITESLAARVMVVGDHGVREVQLTPNGPDWLEGRASDRVAAADLDRVAWTHADRVAGTDADRVPGTDSGRVASADLGPDLDAALLAAGTVPLPPYIRGWSGDPERYQTVYANVAGSAAAPTAGLHFTPELLGRLESAGIELAWLVLHVGLDTFRPVMEDDPTQHAMHSERFSIPAETIAAIERTRRSDGRVVAVGTTSVRALETWAATGQTDGWTDLFIRPGFHFRAVDAMITNFHLPRSTLLMLVSAFAGRERVLAAYRDAVACEYRFFSFGDAMLVL